MTITLHDHRFEPSDMTSWITADGKDAFARVDACRMSEGKERWYHLKPTGKGWELQHMGWGVQTGHGKGVVVRHWDDIETPADDPSMWPMTEGGSALCDYVLSEVGRR